MSAEGTAAKPSEQEQTDPADRLPEGAPEGLKKASRGEKVSGTEEADALDFLLGPTQPLTFPVRVTLDTPKGPAEAEFHIKQIDGARIIALEDKHRTRGTGPFSELDDIAFNAELVSDATEKIVVKRKDGPDYEIDPLGEEWIGGAITPVDAMRTRFRYQSGVLSGVAGEIRRVSGYGPGRVGVAERPVRDAVGGS